MDILTDTEIDSLVASSKIAHKYAQVIDSESAYEILTAKLEEAAKKTEEAEPTTNTTVQKVESFLDNPIVKQVGRTAASIITRSLLGALGLGGRSSKKTSLW
jgi:hypothetical protein